MNLKGESPAKRGAKRKPTELVNVVVCVCHYCSFTVVWAEEREGQLGGVFWNRLQFQVVEWRQMNSEYDWLIVPVPIVNTGWREVVCS